MANKDDTLTDAQRAALKDAQKNAQKDGQKNADVSVREVSSKGPSWGKFPGPRGVQIPLRSAFTRDAYAAVVSHAKESLDKEICGVLAGRVCEDEDGAFILVEAAVRGTAAKQANTHVTFTQETWNIIHKTMDQDYPKLSIVGWYHSHPGFGVEFSEMDMFIQRNFFRSPTQVGMVTDPLGGDVAMIVETEQGTKYISKFWVDGREHKCKLPARLEAESSVGGGGGSVSSGALEKRLEALETRMGQLIQASDDMRASFYRIILSVAMVVGAVIVVWIGWNIVSSWLYRNEPPRNMGTITMPVPVLMDGKTVLVQFDVKTWEIPPALKDAWFEAELKRRLDEAEKLKAQQQGGPTTAPATQQSR
jgi:proteasome lid subunit RPN8/RPN11